MAASPVCSPVVPTRVALHARLALVVADAGWYSTEHLFGELERPGLRTLLLRCLDYRNALQRGWPPWAWARRLRQRRPGLWMRELVLPTGWMKTFPRWGMRPIRRAVAEWRESYAPGGRFALVMTYPHYLYLRDQLAPDVSIYFNVDDYAQYWPRRAARIDALERRAVREADLTVCVSRLRCERLRAAVPEAAGRIRHLPHGAPAASIAPVPHRWPAPPPPDLARVPGPRLGYIGTLEDRVDWELLTRLADALPTASIVLIGRLGRDGARPWQTARRRCLARPNVVHLGWRPQDGLAAYNAAFDVCLIPYDLDHPFNRTCNPTKIMDTMGTGRPIVATALPECRLHDHLFNVADSAEAFIAAVRAILASGSDDGRADSRHDHAIENQCARVAERLLGWLPGL